MVKRFIMTQLWRIQQSYTFLSLVLWGVVIALTAFPFVGAFLQHQFGFDPAAPGFVAATLILLFLTVFAGLFSFGVVYDKYLRLWREQLDVMVEKNPYAREKLSPKEILMWRYIYLPAMRLSGPDNPNTRKEIEFVERWVEISIAADPNIRRAVEEAERWIRSGAPAPK